MRKYEKGRQRIPGQVQRGFVIVGQKSYLPYRDNPPFWSHHTALEHHKVLVHHPIVRETSLQRHRHTLISFQASQL